LTNMYSDTLIELSKATFQASINASKSVQYPYRS
jgi:hypothetical protein